MSDAEILASEHPVPGAISPPVGEGHGVERDHVHGLSDRGYFAIFVILAVITAIEVAWSYLPWSEATASHLAEVAGLLVLMVIKFGLVASRFMHLKFDDKLLSRIFYAGLILAVTVYVVALLTFHVFKGTHYVT